MYFAILYLVFLNCYKTIFVICEKEDVRMLLNVYVDMPMVHVPGVLYWE